MMKIDDDEVYDVDTDDYTGIGYKQMEMNHWQ